MGVVYDLLSYHKVLLININWVARVKGFDVELSEPLMNSDMHNHHDSIGCYKSSNE